MPELLLGLDVGTTSVVAALFAPDGRSLGLGRRRLTSASPSPGRVEQDAAAVWRAARAAMRAALAQAGRQAADLAAIGIASQRASAVIWDRATGAPRSPLVVWSDLRGLQRAGELREAGFMIAPQQSAAKLEGMMAAVEGGAPLAWGNIDSYILFRLSGGEAHVCDRSQAWPSGYLDLASQGWNPALIAHQGLDPDAFPTLVDTWGPIARVDPRILGAATPICADIADQQAALVAHGESEGLIKATFGTSATLDLSTGPRLVFRDMSIPPFIIASAAGETRYCLEGMVYTAGAALDWVRGLLRLGDVEAFDARAASVADSGGAWFLPALQGLGAPYGQGLVRGALGGLSLATGPAQVARAALEGVAFRAREVFDHLCRAAGQPPPPSLAVDGGLTASRLFLQIQADALGRPVRRYAHAEATACGAAICAGRGAGLAISTEAFAAYDLTVEPRLSADETEARFSAWKAAAVGPTAAA